MRLLLLACFLITLMACSKDSYSPMGTDAPPPPEPAGPPDTTISFLALGDSYTIGTSVSGTQRWPAQLAARLAADKRIAVEPLDIVARNGWRTDNLANALASSPPAEDYDLVSLLIGVNDQYQGFDVAGYRGRFENLLRNAIALAGGDSSRVFVVSIPDYAYTPAGRRSAAISADIDAFNAAASAIAQRYEVPFYNITPISRRGNDDPELVAVDGLHPSGKQYGLWVDEVLLQRVAGLVKSTD
ncbi:SGNH/GDSL hydrolase family protein [Lewinella sp. IMCC34183]|uniref:SGNH/GDSL hydrolase family protein n=1 Tax=Lewinella sp. IMCC34183 TaxID=2248762 RepID=UPI0018E5707A|nr:SGNH/GDSL hydrolase family protein [Lewinella sp. IMCC34183]